VPFFKDYYNDPNRIAGRMAKSASDNFQAIIKRNREASISAAAARQRSDFERQMKNAGPKPYPRTPRAGSDIPPVSLRHSGI
jgi:hypothetical protein